MRWSRETIVVFVKQNFKEILYAFLASIIIVLSCFYLFNSKNEVEDYNQISSEHNMKKSNDSPIKEDDKISKVMVDIKGQVKNPGVYESTNDKRVKDIISEAGGLLSEADTSSINLSQKLKDQMVIIVNKKGERSTNIPQNKKDVVNINSATIEELQKISGIGKSKAQAIIDYRDNKGEFKTKDDLMKVKGIGKGIFEKIKDKIEV